MRDVIRVERVPEPEGATSAAAGSSVAPDAPSIDAGSLAAIERVADEVLPSIVARLAVSSLGEIEVRHADWHIRVRRSHGATDDPPAGVPGHRDEAGAGEDGKLAAAAPPVHHGDIATSPAVGYFVPRPDLVVGSRVQAGDGIGWIDVLGVRQEVVSPVDGLVGKLFVEAGDPVEYGQELAQLVPAGAAGNVGDPDGSEA